MSTFVAQHCKKLKRSLKIWPNLDDNLWLKWPQKRTKYHIVELRVTLISRRQVNLRAMGTLNSHTNQGLLGWSSFVKGVKNQLTLL